MVINARERIMAGDEAKACALELRLMLAMDKRVLEKREVSGEEIVPKAGRRNAFGTNCASDRVGPLEHHHAPAGASQAKCCHEPVMAGSYDDGIGVSHWRVDPLSSAGSMPPCVKARGNPIQIFFGPRAFRCGA